MFVRSCSAVQLSVEALYPVLVNTANRFICLREIDTKIIAIGRS